MNKITVTLEVTPQQMVDIGYILDRPGRVRVPESPSHERGMCESVVEVPTEAKEVTQDKVHAGETKAPTESSTAPVKGFPKPITNKEVKPTATRKKGGKKSTAMPSFGRSKAQVESYVKSEEERTVALDEEEELKEQRRQERLARKEEKDAEAAEKKEEAARESKVIEEIKAAANKPRSGAPLPPKPWKTK